MEKNEVLMKLRDLYSENDKESDYVIESKTIDKNQYLTLITKEKNEFEATNPDYENFINLLKYQNTSDCIYSAKKLQDNKNKILVELPEDQRAKFFHDMKEFQNKLLSANSRNLPFIISIINDWVNDMTK